MTDLAIIIVSFNTKKLTLECLDSVIKEGSKLKKEIIVVDNNSQDASQEALQKLKGKINNFLLIKNENNLGFSKAVNQGIGKTKAEYILLLNSDTKVKKGSFGKLLTFARKTPNAGVIGSKLVNADGSLQNSCVYFPTIFRAIKQYWLNQGNYFSKYSPKGNQPSEVEVVAGAAFLITPTALKKVGKLDERYYFYYEDIDYCRKVIKSGLKVYYLPQSVVVHYHGVSGKKIKPAEDQWRRLIPGSIVYHGWLKHNLLRWIMWLGQKKNILLKINEDKN